MIRTRLYQILAQRRNGGERITIRSLAKSAGVDYSSLWRWGNGQINSTNHDMLTALCRELNVTPGDLLEYVPDPAVSLAGDGRDGHESETEAASV